MTKDYTHLSICAETAVERQAAALFAEELRRRTGIVPPIMSAVQAPCVRFAQAAHLPDKDSFILKEQDGVLTIMGQGIRALIYGYSLFLRKSVYTDGRITLVADVVGTYAPDKKIRGHQLGYRACNNTYDAWSLDDYRQYYLDMMAFGSNTVEHIPASASSARNDLMRYDPDDLCMQACALADSFDLDVSLWYPNDQKELDESVSERKAYFEQCPRLDAVFPPGGDPGDYPADVFMQRVRAIASALKEVKSKAQMWPSAQAPHSVPGWGAALMEELQKEDTPVDGIITGPNRAFPIDELRRRLPARYPIRLYPDITHNVRCEYPVHFLQDDWHYALAAALSRECINPRPEEYRLIHRLTRQYVVGSVSYSEGVNDDVNKMVWADMDFDPNRTLRDTLLDYARCFIWQAPAERIADVIYGLERNWIGDPAENPQIDATLREAEALAEAYPALAENWRFCQLFFRAGCDALVRRRRLFELSLLEDARAVLRRNDLARAVAILQTPFDADYLALRETVDDLAQRLFRQIGMQLDTARFGASQWERGATLDTLDLPVTDRAFYLNRLAFAQTLSAQEQPAFIDALLRRNAVGGDVVFYYSVAEHGLDAAGEKQTPDFYMDFQGDDPEVNNGTIPMCQLKLFDHFSFRFLLAGLSAGDYNLRVSYSAHKDDAVTQHTVSLDGKVVYCGAQYGGEKDAEFDRRFLAPGTETATYRLPHDCFTNGCAELVIEEPTQGVKLSEFWIIRADT